MRSRTPPENRTWIAAQVATVGGWRTSRNRWIGVAAATGFSGVVRVDSAGRVELAKAYGAAHRGHGIPNAADTRFGIASGTKGLTALTVVRLIEEGRLDLETTARSVLGDDLPLIDDRRDRRAPPGPPLGHRRLLRRGRRRADTAYVLPVPVHRLDTTADYLAVLDGYPQKVPPGERFASTTRLRRPRADRERVSGMPFPELVRTACARRRACAHRLPALRRADGRVALGYLDGGGLRINVFHLPVRGSGDGGVFTTAADIHALWAAFYAGRIVPRTCSRRWSGPAATRRRSRCATAWASGCTRQAARVPGGLRRRCVVPGRSTTRRPA